MKIRKQLTVFCILQFAFSIYSNAQIVYTNINPDLTFICKDGGCTKSYALDLNNDGTTDFSIGVFKIAGNPDYQLTVSAGASPGNAIAGSGSYPAQLSSGANINSALLWTTYSSHLRSYSSYYGSYSGNWIASSDRFLGLRMQVGTNTYYGWVRLSVSVTTKSASFKIKDYAFNSTPNHSILAGSTSGARLDEENILNVNDLLLNVFPNPVSQTSTISFSLSQPEKVSLRIFDLSGRLISTLAGNIFEDGKNEVIWNATDLNDGIYFLQIHAGEIILTEKMIVIK